MFWKKSSSPGSKEFQECLNRVRDLERKNVELTLEVKALEQMLRQTNASLQLVCAAHQQLTVDMQIIYDTLKEAVQGATGDGELEQMLWWSVNDDDDDLPN